MTARLDAKDMAILRALEADGRAGYAEIGRKVGLTGPAAAERVARLTADGVIQGFTARIDPAALGRSVSAIIELSPTTGSYERLLEELSEMPEVEVCYAVTGDALAVLIVRVESNEALRRFCQRLHAVGRTRTSIILMTIQGAGLLQDG